MSWLKLTRWEMKKGIHILTMTISHQQSDATWNRSRRLTCTRWPKLPTSRTGTASRTSTSIWQTSASTTTSPKLALANITNARSIQLYVITLCMIIICGKMSCCHRKTVFLFQKLYFSYVLLAPFCYNPLAKLEML